MKAKLFSLIAIIPALTLAQYNNGPLSTGPTANNGAAAPAGYTWSEVQANAGNTTEANTNAGYGAMNISASSNNFLADDFTVPAGEVWQISTIDVFAYQTGYAGTTSPFNSMTINIYNGDPSTAAASVFGDDTTNRFQSSTDGMMYRIFNSTVPNTANPPGTTRKIWKITGNAPTTLTAGTYWMVFQLKNVVQTNGGFTPAVTITGTRGLPTFNGKQLNAVTNTWTDLIDAGSPATAPDYPMDVPFIITYAVLGTNETVQYDNRVVLYPNPARDSFSIELPKESKTKATVVEIYDMSGKLVKKMPMAESYNSADLQAGSYLVKINDGTNTKVTRLIKK